MTSIFTQLIGEILQNFPTLHSFTHVDSTSEGFASSPESSAHGVGAHSQTLIKASQPNHQYVARNL